MFNSPQCDWLPAFPQSKTGLQVKFLKSCVINSYFYEYLKHLWIYKTTLYDILLDIY